MSPLVAPPWCRLVMPAAGCCIASCRPRIVPPSHRLVVPAGVALPLAVLSLRCPLFVLLRQLVAALPLAVLSLRHPLVNSSRQLVVASPLLVLSLCPAPPSPPLVMTAGCCVASQHVTLSLSCRLAVSPSLCLVVPPLVVLYHRQMPTSNFVHHSCQTLTPAVATRHHSCQFPSSSRHRLSVAPTAAIECPPLRHPPPLNAVFIFIVHRHHYCHHHHHHLHC